MDLQTSHLAAALMSGDTYTASGDSTMAATPGSSKDEIIVEKPVEPRKESMEEDKEEAPSEDFSDEESEAQPGNKSVPGRGVTLQMLLEDKMLEPGTAAMTIEYLGQKFVGDLQPDGKIKSHETETIFCSPSAWAIHCKRIINPDKRSGCGWASVKYKGKKLDTIKATYLRKKSIQRENMHTDEETEMEVEHPPEPPPQRTVMKHNTVPNRMMQHDSNMLIEAVSFSSAGKVQPFLVAISSNASLVLDIHCHLKKEEVYGYLAGTWDLNTHNITITHTFPCLISKNDHRPRVMVELEIQMEIEKLGLILLGWYHSHPTNPAMPSLRDCDNQLEYQIKMRGPSEISYIPCIGVICSPYNPESPVLESSLTFFWVMPPPEQRPTEYPRPLLLQYNLTRDSHLSTHAMEQIKKSIKYYFTFPDESCIDFKDSFKPDITYLDKLKCTLTAKFPREQSDGLLWQFIRDELGCSSEQDDKMDLDALLAVPQQIPVSKPSQTTSVSNFPSVSTLQQMVSRPAGVPPINVSSGIGSGSPHKFETPQLNIPVLPSSSKSSSKSVTPTLPSAYPTGLDMLTSMALGLGSSNLPLGMGPTGLDSLAAANSMLTGLSPRMPSGLAVSLSGSKLPDPPSYTASLQNLTSNIASYEKTSSSTSTTTTPSTAPIPASLASNLMMSSADIANALFSASKYSSAGILGIPDPMSKSTLAANNMFLSPSLIKMQESLMKPLSTSSPISSKAGLDQNVLMKSPHDLLGKSSKDYLPPDFGSVGKGKSDTNPLESLKMAEPSVTSEVDSSKSENMDVQATDFSVPSRIGGESFLNQMMELTKKATMSDYLSDYNQPLKLTKPDDLVTSNTPPTHSYNTSSIVDTIAQVALGNFAKHDEPKDYKLPGASKVASDYSTSKMTGDYSTSKASGEYGSTKLLGDYSTSKVTGDYSTSKVTGDYSAPKVAADYSNTKLAGDYSTAKAVGDSGSSTMPGDYSTSKETVDFSSSKAAADYSTNKVTGEFSTTKGSGDSSSSKMPGDCNTSKMTGDYSTTKVVGDYSANKMSGEYSTSKMLGDYSTSTVTGDYSTSKVAGDYITSQVAGDYSTSKVTGDYNTSKVAGDYSSSKVAGDYITSQVAGDYSTSKVIGDYSTSKVAGDYSSSKVAGDYSTTKVPGDYSTSKVAGDYSTSKMPGEFSTSKVASDYSTSKIPGDYSASAVAGDYSMSQVTGDYSTSKVAGDFSKMTDDYSANKIADYSKMTDDYSANKIANKMPSDYITSKISDYSNMPGDYSASNIMPGDYSGNKSQSDYSSTKMSVDYSVTNVPMDYNVAQVPSEYGVSKIPGEYSSNKVPAEYGPNKISDYCTPKMPGDYSATKMTGEYITSKMTGDYSTPKISTDYITPKMAGDYSTTKMLGDYSTIKIPGDYSVPPMSGDYSSSITGDYSIPNMPGDYNVPNMPGDYSTPNMPGDYSTSTLITGNENEN